MKNKNFRNEKTFTKKWFYVAVISGVVFALITTMIAIFRSVKPKQQTKKIIQNNYIPTETIKKDVAKSSEQNTLKENENIKKEKDNFKPESEMQKVEDKDKQKEKLNKKTEKKEKPKKDNSKETPKNNNSKTEKTQKKTKQDKLETKIKKLETLKFEKPIEGRITRPYSYEKVVKWPVMGLWKTHDGIDIEAKKNTPVKAIMDGSVTKVLAVEKNSWQGVVEIAHKNGLFSIYKGLDINKINVKEGQQVEKGEILGALGDTTTMHEESNQLNHLHLEMNIEYDENSKENENLAIIEPKKIIKITKWLDPNKYLKYETKSYQTT